MNRQKRKQGEIESSVHMPSDERGLKTRFIARFISSGKILYDGMEMEDLCTQII